MRMVDLWREGRPRRAELLLAFVIAVALSLSACGDDSPDADKSPTETTNPAADSQAPEETGSTPETDATSEGGRTPAPSDCRVDPAERSLPTSVEPPANGEVLDQGEPATASVQTNLGDFEFELDTERAPITTNSFAYLAERGFFDGLRFHRIAPGFVIQGGDPLGNGTGGPGYTCVEAPPRDIVYTKGVVAMAKAATEPPGASGSQFFVVTAGAVPLPPQYAIAGQVTDGLDVVEKIGRLGTPSERPTREITIRSIEIEDG